jgi:hypothetical protein
MFNYKNTNKVFEETATLILKDPETEMDLEVDGKPVSITVYGQSSQKYQKLMDVLATKERAGNNKNKSLEVRKKESIDLLVQLSVSTENMEDGSGTPITTAQQFRELYSEESVSWIRDQVTAFVFNSSNFLKK